MAQTLITRISKLEQYDSDAKTIDWEDLTEIRWENDNVYGLLNQGDNAIFIANKKLLIGTISEIQKENHRIQCNNIKEVRCENDHFLRLHEAYPELISRVKANFNPFIHPHVLNIEQLVKDANDRKFVSHYVVASLVKYNELKARFNENDRIVLVDSHNKLENVKLHTNEGLINFLVELDINIGVQGMTIDNILAINEDAASGKKQSNNLNRIKALKSEIESNGYYKFTSFFSYYDGLYNKKVYEGQKPKENLFQILYSQPISVYKISMSGKTGEIIDDAFSYFSKNNLLVVHKDTKAKGTSHQLQGETFSKQMKQGDYFYLCRGNDFLVLIGKITSGAVECEYEDFGKNGWLQRSYEIVHTAVISDSYKGDQKWWTPNDNSTCIEIPNKEIEDANEKIFIPYFETKFKFNDTVLDSNKTENKIQMSLNQILYGPPGTGKTYNTVNRALQILGENISDISREEIKHLFDEKVEAGQIVFTTFHQSLNYEDFIEGIKPIEPEKEGDPVIYRVEYGIFRNLCIEAAFAIAQLRETKKTEEVLDFSILYDKFSEDIGEKLLSGKEVELDTKAGGSVMVEAISQQGNFIIKHHQGTRNYTVSKARLTKLQSAIENLDDVSNINDQFREIIGGSNSSAYWSVLNAIRKEKRTQLVKQEKRAYTFDEKKEVVLSLLKSDYKNKKGKPYVLIIDEINRGNVSQILGELITLIEDDKRLGKDEALEAKLPYSKEKFGVPPNLHIIGTMNTADRSVEALDTALRRRFCFIEMPPRYDLDELQFEIAGHKACDILRIINKRIEKLIDKDHLIGHSYFIGSKQLGNMKSVFQNNIIPLLQEYFFGDYGKIGLVLGADFFETIEEHSEDIFAAFNDYDAAEFSERPIYKLKNVVEMSNEDFTKALKTLLKK